MPVLTLRTFGDPVLGRVADEVPESEWGGLRRLMDDMLPIMYRAPGVGLAAPQVGISKRFFVWDVGDGPGAVVNPVILETDGSQEAEEGCLSVPQLYFPIRRAARVHLKGWDVDGKEIDIVGEGLLGRLFLHETDHLDGHLLLEQLDEEVRKAALKILRHRAMGLPPPELPVGVRDRARPD